MTDGRQHLRAEHPRGLKSKKCISVYFDPDEYSELYNAAALAGTSVAETVRKAVREMTASTLTGEDT